MSNITEIVDFSGGMNTLLAPHLIQKNEARTLVNVDIRFGALQSMPNLNEVEPLPGGPFFYEYLGKVHSYPSWRSNVLWDGKWYWSSSFSNGKMLPDGTELPLGLPTPTTELTIAVEGDGPHEGDFKYTYTFYSTTTGAESAPAPLPKYLKGEGNNIKLTGFEPLPTGADRYKIYRIGGYLPMFAQVETTSATDYLDTLDDTKIDGRILQTMRNGQAPQRLKNLVELNGRFYGTVGNKIYFSALGNPDSWYISDYFIVRGYITALGTVPGGLLILGASATSLLYGTDPSNFRLKLISDQYGCQSKESVAYLSDSVIWLSDKQIVMCNGYKIMDVTAFKVDRIRGIIATGAVVENETYYCSFKPGLFPSDILYPRDDLYSDTAEGTGLVNQGIIALDFKRGNSFSYKMIDYDEIRTLGIVKNNVHVSTGGYKSDVTECEEPMYADCISYSNCTPFALNLMNIYEGQGATRLYYLSPRYIDSGLSVLKQYDKVRVQLRGAFNIKVLLDDGNIVVEQDIIADPDSDTFHLIGIPNKNNLGYYIQFLIVGIGVVSSIQYSWQSRKLVN